MNRGLGFDSSSTCVIFTLKVVIETPRYRRCRKGSVIGLAFRAEPSKQYYLLHAKGAIHRRKLLEDRIGSVFYTTCLNKKRATLLFDNNFLVS